MVAMADDKQTQRRSTVAIYPRVFTIITLGILAYLLFLILAPFLTVLGWSVLIAFLLHPAYRRLTRYLGGRKGLSSVLLTLATFFIFIGPLTAVGVAFVRQAAALVEQLQTNYGELKFTGLSSLESIPFLGSVPFDRQLALAADRGEAFVAAASARESARALAQIARAIRASLATGS